MENVLDILKKEDGTYAKSAMASLLTMRYQVRIGVIAACDQGVPQSRNRCAPACCQHHTVVAVNCSCCPVSDDATQHLMRKRVELLLFVGVLNVRVNTSNSTMTNGPARQMWVYSHVLLHANPTELLQ